MLQILPEFFEVLLRNRDDVVYVEAVGRQVEVVLNGIGFVDVDFTLRVHRGDGCFEAEDFFVEEEVVLIIQIYITNLILEIA